VADECRIRAWFPGLPDPIRTLSIVEFEARLAQIPAIERMRRGDYTVDDAMGEQMDLVAEAVEAMRGF
jgi:hypothetical protein